LSVNGVFPTGAVDVAMDILFPTPDPYINDPAGWVQDKLKNHLWSKQVEILESVRDNRYTAVKACHGPGKSFTAARAVCWWLDRHELGSAFAVTTAPSWPQVEAILWREIIRAHRHGKLKGRITRECHWYMGEGRSDEELIAMGRKPADYDEQAFQGIHARYVLIVIDEACGVPPALVDAAKTLMTNPYARILAIGNPDDPATWFADACKPGSGWNTITIPVWSTPNFTDEQIPDDLRLDLPSEEWVEERRGDWGEGSNYWTSKVEAEFPDVSDEFLISPAMIQKGFQTQLPGLEHGRYGIDVARMGDDKTSIYRNRGGYIRHVDTWGKTDTMQTAGKVGLILGKHYPRNIPATIDAIGVGAGVADRLRERGFEISHFEGSTRAYRFNRFKNRRAEAYWSFRTRLENGLIDLDPEDQKLAAELQNIKYSIDSSQRIVIESKEDMKKRGVPSPNRADAAVLSATSLSVSVEEILASDGLSDEPLADDLYDKVM